MARCEHDWVETRILFTRVVNTLPLAEQSALWDEWLLFERCHGSLEQFVHAESMLATKRSHLYHKQTHVSTREHGKVRKGALREAYTARLPHTGAAKPEHKERPPKGAKKRKERDDQATAEQERPVKRQRASSVLEGCE